MRTAYRQHLDAFAHDLIVLCGTVQTVMDKSLQALLETDLQAAEDALSMTEELEEIQQRCEQRAVELLATEGPLARDLRQVISSIYIVDDLARMGALAQHVAKSARRRHPASAVPQPLLPYFAEMARLISEMGEKVHYLLENPDADIAMVLVTDDDLVDDIHGHLMIMLTRREWPYSTVEAVDVALLGRFLERYADHSVNVSERIVYLTTGLTPTEYQERRSQEKEESDWAKRFTELEARFNSDSPR
ncbi:phosphate signaling complex protein PhoU [Corynebacterium sp. H128]|uniref:phosphate signaling complex protein PhoU n=1 Tax=unclassified Corynebacterium TaxID=2624378 RepID=UPI0030A5FFB7